MYRQRVACWAHHHGGTWDANVGGRPDVDLCCPKAVLFMDAQVASVPLDARCYREDGGPVPECRRCILHPTQLVWPALMLLTCQDACCADWQTACRGGFTTAVGPRLLHYLQSQVPTSSSCCKATPHSTRLGRHPLIRCCCY